MKDGTIKKEWHYGYRAHIICDAKYGLPIKSKVTPANNSEQTELDNMLKEMDNNKEKYKLEKMQNLMGDARYETGKRNKKLKEEYKSHEPQAPSKKVLEGTWLERYPQAWAETGGMGETKRVLPIDVNLKLVGLLLGYDNTP